MTQEGAPGIRQLIRNWYIFALGGIFIVGLLALASLDMHGNSVAQTSPQVAQTPSQAAPAPTQPQAATPQSLPQSPPQTANVPSKEPVKQQTVTTPAPKQAPAAKVNPPAPNTPAVTQTTQAPPPAATVAPASPHAAHAAPAVPGDVNAGRLAFGKCQACHSIEAGKNLIGPSLAGIFGNPAGKNASYNYSPAMRGSGATWDAASLHAFLQAPQKFLPKNKMAFPGIQLESERTNIIAYLAASSAQRPNAAPVATAPAAAQKADVPPAKAVETPPSAAASVSYIPDVRYTLRSGISDGRMVYIGVGGTIDNQVNPILSAAEGQVVQITLLNGEGAEHDIVFPDQNAASPRIVGRGTSTILVFRATKAGDFAYYCDVAGHRQAGMEGQFIVTPRPPEQVVIEADISQAPTAVPSPIGKRAPQTIRVDLVAVELEARLAEGTTYGFWTFNGRVPGPMLRARVGDTLDVHVTNSKDSTFIHSVDFHAATGPGGGAVSTQVDPGHTKSFKFKALTPGLYVYHCATPMVAHHITNGMYGLILIEPEEGLPPVDHEFYVMQGEIYTQNAFGHRGRQEFSVEKLLNERPEYFVFNGSVGALSKLHPLKAKTGETVRIFFGVGGPNYTSSFHVIGEIFDRVYSFADLQSPPLKGVQTITVPPGGATIVEFKVDVPGNYILVDHALSRAERGLVGILQVEGPANPEIYDGKIEEGSGH